ncbi:glyoxalase family protein [Metarhizium album ARSEF 1941]|uniref:Glyoxalase family protein n=1 Tax=Metarhizium album (strain ARSEF 1941) TaxID=1081103 RepID=A0A0B2WEY2_METAS|nr:glyoxalase family protein [Metarhizium album ARSEF 1941]KHN94441.1 glyoxalase family protein [Metarhizium album ARSEF 1941]
MAIDHTSLRVPEDKFQKCLAVYLAALQPLGYEVVYQFGPHLVGLGSKHEATKDYKPTDFWVMGTKDTAAAAGLHIAFRAQDRAAVDAFHAAAVEAGAADNGAPGLRPDYHADYYGAFVLDPAGNNIEAVCHLPA